MLFNNKQINRMLNGLLNNNKYARENFVSFVSTLPEQLLEKLFLCQDMECSGRDWYLKTRFTPTAIQIDICCKNALLSVDFYPVTEENVKYIPHDEHNDIFFPDENVVLRSPAYFNIYYNSNTECNGDVLDYNFFIVTKLNEIKTMNYYLVSQSNVDAGIYCSRIDIGDFIVKDYPTRRDVEDDSANPHNPRRSSTSRNYY